MGKRAERGLVEAPTFWCALSITVGLLFALRASLTALADYYVVHDDVRQHVFWLPRLHDPRLFSGDPIADYYAAQAPPGFVGVWFLGTLALDAVTFSKLLPLLLTPLLSGFAYLLGWRLFRRATAAAFSSVLLTAAVWQYDDLASAAPRSFTPLLLVAFLAFLVGRQRLATLLTVALQALLYPPACLTMLGVQTTWLLWPGGRRSPRSVKRQLPWLVASILVAGGLIVLGQRSAAEFGPVISLDQARRMAEFRPGGRASFFIPDPVQFWLLSTRSGLGLAPRDPLLGALPALSLPIALTAALGLVLLLGRLGLIRTPSIPRQSLLLLHLALVSLALFAAAHLLLFRLYLPSRQVQFSLPIVWALSGGLFLALASGWLAARLSPRQAGPAGALINLALIGLLVLHAPPEGEFYVVGRHPRLYEYLRAQPPDTLIAALPTDSSALPLFAQRPVLVSWEHLLPYHPRYYEPLQERSRDLARAYFDESSEPLRELLEREGVDVVVANLSALERRRSERAASRALALEELAERCGAFRDHDLVAIPATCVLAERAAQPQVGGAFTLGR